ncbi:MAG: type II toxin-antitoxin system prevent-host-death family antitoxin [Planctomycetota bacterium]|jgi:antitoxin (DNA-binding transcriptional repressor) of toxin-antitoxin stability system
MESLDVFSARDLRNNVGGLMKDAEAGQLALITKRGRPTAISLPFDQRLLSLGVNRAFALRLYEQGLTTLVQSAKVAEVSVHDFFDMLKEAGIPAVDHPSKEVDREVDLLDSL